MASNLPLSPIWIWISLLGLALVPCVEGHNRNTTAIPVGEAISDDPIDTTLWVHIFLQTVTWGVIFPFGMVLGIAKSRWHVPVQVTGTVISIVGYFLGHMHKGRQFRHNVHDTFATTLSISLLLQVVMGFYLKLHLEKGVNAKIRPWVKRGHSILGKIMPVLAWIQMVFGGITAMGFCQGAYVGQCLSYFIMGSAFIAYGIILTLLLVVGQLWLRRTGRSQEFFDSIVIAAWGCVNAFTEHRWGSQWVKNDWQHTAMGVSWWCAGLAGIWFSKDRHGRPKRNFIPGFVLLLTGWAMSVHPQTLPVSEQAHHIFGYTLMGAGITRIIEISFVLRDQEGLSEDGRELSSFQYIPIFLLYASGVLFMGLNEEQMYLLDRSDMDYVTYILILFSLAFMMFVFVSMLINVYDSASAPGAPHKESTEGRLGPRLNGTVPVRDAQEFELEGLMSEDEDDGPRKDKQRASLDSLSSGEDNDRDGNAQRGAGS